MRKSILITALVALAGVIGMMATSTEAGSTNNKACIKGDIRQHFVIDWSADNRSGVVRTVDNRPLCTDMPLMVSTFTLPTNYDGRGWWIYEEDRLNPTVVPQTLYKTERYTMKKGTNGNIAFKTALNPQCGRWVQIDAYVGNEEIKQIVGKGGIEDRIIQGSITKNPACEQPKPVEKKIDVCNLKEKKTERINEKDYTSTKYSKDLSKCKPETQKPEVKSIPVCNLDTKTTGVIKEDAFDESKHSKELKDCDKTEAPVEEAPKGKGSVVTELPQTGIASTGGLALSAIAASAVAYMRSRRS